MQKEYEYTQLYYDRGDGRISFDGDGFHCGDGCEVLLLDEQGNPTWVWVRFESDGEPDNPNRWYMPSHKGISPIGLWARK
jgi:hypothetical protein